MPIRTRWAAAMAPQAAAAGSGLLLTAAFPKLQLAGLAFVALVPLLAAIADRRPAAAFRLGFLAGLTHYLTLLDWVVYTMHTYGQLPLYLCIPVLGLLAAYLSLYPAMFCAGIVRLRLPVWVLGPAAGALWTALEYLRATLLTGFPWALLGHSLHDRLVLIQIADVTGVYGLSFLIVTVNVAVLTVLSAILKRRWQQTTLWRRQAGIAALICLILTAGVAGYGKWRLEQIGKLLAAAPHPSVAVVQGNIDQARKWDPKFQSASMDKYLLLSLEALAAFPDLVVWPETATPFYLFDHPVLTERVIGFVRRADTVFLIGSPSFRKIGEHVEYFNSAFLLGTGSAQGGRYDKVHLVPFGEYVPLKRFLPFIGKMVAQVGDFKPGAPGATLAWNARHLGVQICYEIIFAPLARQMVANGADLLVNITNDAWFGSTAAPHQHFAMTVFRAVENRRTLVRAANTGISGIVAPTGQILAQTDLFVEATLARPAALLSLRTFYTRFGDLWAWLCLAATAVLAIVGRPGRRATGLGLIHPPPEGSLRGGSCQRGRR